VPLLHRLTPRLDALLESGCLLGHGLRSVGVTCGILLLFRRRPCKPLARRVSRPPLCLLSLSVQVFSDGLASVSRYSILVQRLCRGRKKESRVYRVRRCGCRSILYAGGRADRGSRWRRVDTSTRWSGKRVGRCTSKSIECCHRRDGRLKERCGGGVVDELHLLLILLSARWALRLRLLPVLDCLEVPLLQRPFHALFSRYNLSQLSSLPDTCSLRTKSLHQALRERLNERLHVCRTCFVEPVQRTLPVRRETAPTLRMYLSLAFCASLTATFGCHRSHPEQGRRRRR
jgi:hypothetical protein